jgi:WD40 repeat protein
MVQRCAGHEGPVRCIEWRSDALLFLSGSDDRSVRVWRRESADCAFECCATLYGHDGRVWSCALFAQGTAFCSASEDGSLRQWSLADAAAPECVRVDQCHASDVWQVATCDVPAHRRSMLASVSRDGSVRVWRSSTSAPFCDNMLQDATLQLASSARATAVCVCATTATVFVGFACGRVARLTSERHESLLGELGGRGVSCLSACAHSLVVGLNSGEVVMLNRSRPSELWRTQPHRERVRFAECVTLRDGTALLLSSAQGAGLAIATPTATVHVRYDGASAVTSAKFGAACVFSVAVVESIGCIVAGDSSGSLHLCAPPGVFSAAASAWCGALRGDCTVSLRVHNGERVSALHVRLAAESFVVVMSMGRDGCVAETRFDVDAAAGRVRGAVLRQSRVMAGILPPSNRVRCERFSPCGSIALLHGRTFAAMADCASGFVFVGGMPPTPSLGVLYDCAVVDGVLWAAHLVGASALCIAAARVEQPLLPPLHSQYVDAAHYVSSVELACTGGEDTHVRLWDARTRVAVAELHAHSGAVFCFASVDNVLLSGGACGEVFEHALTRVADARVLVEQRNAASWKLVAAALGADGRVISMVAWRDGEAAQLLRVALGTGDGRVLCDASVELSAVARLGCAVFSLARVGDVLLAGAADGGIRVIRWRDATVLARLSEGHQSGVTALCATERRRVVSGGDDQALLVADYDDAWRCVRCVRVPLAHGAAVRGVELLGDGAALVSASADERVCVWRLDDDDGGGSGGGALSVTRVSAQASRVEETSAMAVCCGGAAVLVVGNGASFIDL